MQLERKTSQIQSELSVEGCLAEGLIDLQHMTHIDENAPLDSKNKHAMADLFIDHCQLERYPQSSVDSPVHA